jgi:hypothetical protein
VRQVLQQAPYKQLSEKPRQPELVSNIAIDTGEVATDTIDYVATDNDGNAATSTRTVIIETDVSSATTTASN